MNSILNGVPFSAFMLGRATLAQLPAPGGASSWCAAITAAGGSCSGVSGTNTVVGLSIAGRPGRLDPGRARSRSARSRSARSRSARFPVGSIDLVASRLAGIPVGSIPAATRGRGRRLTLPRRLDARGREVRGADQAGSAAETPRRRVPGRPRVERPDHGDRPAVRARVGRIPDRRLPALRRHRRRRALPPRVLAHLPRAVELRRARAPAGGLAVQARHDALALRHGDARHRREPDHHLALRRSLVRPARDAVCGGCRFATGRAHVRRARRD